MSEDPNLTGQDHIALFQHRAIRRTWHDNRWWFAVSYVIAVLTDSADPAQYIKKIRLRDDELAKGWVQIVTPLRINKTKTQKEQLHLADNKDQGDD